jgi:hypothetical protein
MSYIKLQLQDIKEDIKEQEDMEQQEAYNGIF